MLLSPFISPSPSSPQPLSKSLFSMSASQLHNLCFGCLFSWNVSIRRVELALFINTSWLIDNWLIDSLINQSWTRCGTWWALDRYLLNEWINEWFLWLVILGKGTCLRDEYLSPLWAIFLPAIQWTRGVWG